MDDLVVVVDELGEAEDVAVVVDEPVHVAELDVADAVVDLEEVHARRGARRLLDLPVARREHAVVVAPVDERVADLAVRADRAPAQDAVLAAVELDGLDRRRRAAGRRLAPGRGGVVDAERDVLDAVAVLVDVLGDLAVRAQRAGHDERDVVLAHDVADAIADARLEARVGDRREAPQRAEVVRRLLGVADPELDVVDAVQGQEVLGLLVGVLVEVRAGLVGGAAGDRLGHVNGLRSSARMVVPDAIAAATARGRHGMPLQQKEPRHSTGLPILEVVDAGVSRSRRTGTSR